MQDSCGFLIKQIHDTMKKKANNPKKSGFMARLEAMQKEQQRMARENAKANSKKYR